MRLFLLTALTMTAFATNSILTRYAIDGGYADPFGFSILRVLSGAVVLVIILQRTGPSLEWFSKERFFGALSLALYMIGFSIAYVTLDAGLGALILFGVVQTTMFAHAASTGNRPTPLQFAGATIAFAGLALALWPDADSTGSLTGAAAMVCAGIGWAAYTLVGRTATHPIAATAASFALCFPILLVTMMPFVSGVSMRGWVLAFLCGGVTSGLGYALWYRVLPSLNAAVAATVQLSVPVIAILAGAVFLGEEITLSVLLAAGLVLSGIALATRKVRVPVDRS
ncbi:MAG: DMT family transporter [Roseobacter sp.]